MNSPFSLEGKVVLITGASSGIGRATAIECSKLGATVIITARNEERLNETYSMLANNDLGHKIIVADLTSGEDVEMLGESIDILHGVVLCSGKGLTAPFQFATSDKFDDIFKVNLFAPVELFRFLYRKKKILNAGSVVFVSSIGGNSSFLVGNSVYGASKAAFNSMMKYCAKECSARLIRVNSVNPGMTNTPFIANSSFTDEQLRQNIETYPLKRYGEPQDVAYGIIYLLSDASSWVTGHSLVIDGGKTLC